MSVVAPPPPAPGATEQLAAFACDTARTGDLRTRSALQRLIPDTVGVAVAGLATDPVRLLREWHQEQTGAPAGGGLATVWGTDDRVSRADAALINGTAAHALDWDDAAPSMAMHPAAVLLPTLFSLAAGRPVSGADLDAAYCVGSATFRAVSEILPHQLHYGRGWHNTSTTGRLAATAAGARLLGLDAPTTAHAIGIAASHAAGSLSNFGTMTKPMHAGSAARDAVMAIGLAARGFTANPAQLEARGGFLDLFGDHDPDRVATLRDRLDHWLTGWVDDYAIKAHPSCFATQRAINAGYWMRDQLGADLQTTLADVERIEVTLEQGGTRPLRDSAPTTGLEAKFSLEYTLALALLQGRVELADFTDAAQARPEVRALMDRITLSERAPAMGPGFTVVSLHTRSGQHLERTVQHARGEAANPLDGAELAAKFAQCVGTDPASATWFEALYALPDSPRGQGLQSLLAGPAVPSHPAAGDHAAADTTRRIRP